MKNNEVEQGRTCFINAEQLHGNIHTHQTHVEQREETFNLVI